MAMRQVKVPSVLPIYGAAGEGFERLNIACPRTTLLEGLKRLKQAADSYRFTKS